VNFYGFKLIGINAYTDDKLFTTLVVTVAFMIVRFFLNGLIQTLSRGRAGFWVRQASDVLTTGILALALLSVWFENPEHLAMAVSLITAGLAFALQRVITSLAGYLVILRGKTFNVGDRITMGGVRGDVIALGFIQTTILEMGQPPAVQNANPAVWVFGRQFTGRIVMISNSVIFDEPVYNYSRDFPFIWEEMHIPITYKEDREHTETILLEVANRHTKALQASGKDAIERMMQRYDMPPADIQPSVFYRITDNWLELGLRFIAPTHGARDLKDAMSRDILREFDRFGIGIASATYDIVGLPTIRVVSQNSAVDGTSSNAPA
jgi:small-conductance mechanosensitive channel